jgi:3-deoxy-manno-octulosonate cytidylyltransferase (CMP-KDO synthetase)
MKQVVIIPARFESTRLPGKPLVLIMGKSLIRRVWERSVAAVGANKVFVATDDDRIRQHCNTFGAQVVMTPRDCLTGTDRLFEANKILRADSVINVQGDEPLVNPEDISLIAREHLLNTDIILNGMGLLSDEVEYRSSTVPKVVTTPARKLLYVSRGPIPSNKKSAFYGGFKQICVYGFSAAHLEAFGLRGDKTPLEGTEDIEILRFLEMGFDVQMVEVKSPSIAVDVPEDILRVEAALKKSGELQL